MVQKIRVKIWVKKIFDPKISVPQKVGTKDLGQKKYWSKKLRPPKTYLVRNGSVTAEIFLKWTNVARTNVTWTNVTIKVFIC